MSIDNKFVVSSLKKYPLLTICCVISLGLVLTLFLRSDLSINQKTEFEKYALEAKKLQSNVVNSALLAEQLIFLTQANQAARDRSLSAEGVADKLQYFYRLESETGIRYLDLRAGSKTILDKKSPPSYVPLNYILSVEGEFGQIINFLRNLEQGIYFTRITSASSSGSGALVKVSLNLDILGIP